MVGSTDHYFTNNDIKSNLKKIEFIYNDISFIFYSDNGVFSKNYIDYGTRTLISTYLKYNSASKKILDVGCGYGVIGIIISKITSSQVDGIDINKRSVHLAQMNADINKVNSKVFVSNVYEAVTSKYDVIITNPPIRAGKKIVLDILVGARDYLTDEGEVWFVIRKDQGALSTKKVLENYYKVDLIYKDKGYFIFCAKKRLD
ncbi:MAG: methyltransferase [Bacilli bacterium]